MRPITPRHRAQLLHPERIATLHALLALARSRGCHKAATKIIAKLTDVRFWTAHVRKDVRR